jgi:hypothetical protein
LARLDPVTAIQFASVYRRLEDLDELSEVVRRLREEPVPGTDQLALEDSSDVPGNIDRSPVRAPRATKEQRRTNVREH